MNNDVKEYEVVRLNKDNVSDLERLYEAVYKKKALPFYFKKKYDTAYTGIENMGYIAYKEQLPIAFYGVIPCFILYENKKVPAAQSADTMTHPEHRYKSLFSDLSKMCFELCRQNGIKLIYGFPNQNSYHGAIKLGWKMTETMDCFSITVQQNVFEKIILKLNKQKQAAVLKKYAVNKTCLKNSVIQDGFSGLYRDEFFLQYKTYSDTSIIEIANSKLWISFKNGLTIGDIEMNENHFDELISAIKVFAKKSGIHTIYFHACKGTSLHHLFAKKCSSIPSFPVLFQAFDETIDVAKIKFTFADIDIF